MKRSQKYFRGLKWAVRSSALGYSGRGGYRVRARRGAALAGWEDALTSLVSGAEKFGAAAQKVSLIGQSPAKMSWTSIYGLQATNPALAAQYAAIKTQAEAAKPVKQKALAPAMMAAYDLPVQPAPAPSALPTWALPAALGVGAVYLMTKKK